MDTIQTTHRHWLTRRDDQVYAKGKGLMTTFWCEPKFGSIKSSQRTSATTHISDSFASRNDDESKNLSFRDSSNNNNNIRPEEAPPELECPPPTTVYPSSDDSNVSDCEAMA